MKKSMMFFLLLFNYPAWAHHTKDHTMLMENSDQVISMTQQGANNSWFWIAWAVVIIVLCLGIVRVINKNE